MYHAVRTEEVRRCQLAPAWTLRSLWYGNRLQPAKDTHVDEMELMDV